MMTFLLLSHNTYSQTYAAPLSLVSTSGGTGQISIGTTNASVDWSIGEAIIGQGHDQYRNAVIGIHQPAVSKKVHTLDPLWDDLQVYPNPAHTHIIAAGLPEGSQLIQLVRSDGQIVSSMKSDEHTVRIQTSQLSSGVYYLCITSADGRVRTTGVTIFH